MRGTELSFSFSSYSRYRYTATRGLCISSQIFISSFGPLEPGALFSPLPPPSILAQKKESIGVHPRVSTLMQSSFQRKKKKKSLFPLGGLSTMRLKVDMICVSYPTSPNIVMRMYFVVRGRKKKAKCLVEHTLGLGCIIRARPPDRLPYYSYYTITVVYGAAGDRIPYNFTTQL